MPPFGQLDRAAHETTCAQPAALRTRRQRTTRRNLWIALAVALATGLPLQAQDDSPSVVTPQAWRGGAPAHPAITLFTNLPGHPTAQVPGLPPGTEFGPGTGSTHFDRPFGSRNGQWILSADTTLATTEDEVILVNGTVVVREGTPTGVAGNTDLVGLIDARLAINDAGDYAFATNTSATTADDVIQQVVGGVAAFAAQEGQPVPGLDGVTFGATLDSTVIASDGRVGFAADGMSGAPAGQNEALIIGPTLLAVTGIDVPGNQLGSESWENFDLDDFWIDAAGARWLAQGDLSGATTSDGVVVVSGDVVVQEGVVLAGSGFTDPVDLSGIVGVHMAPDGRWFVRGNNDVSELDWVYGDGAVVAAVDQPITTGATELWSDDEFADCFFLHVGDGFGNVVIGGVSNAATEANGVLVYNGSEVIAREGDPVDLDGDGLFDDDAFFATFGNDDGVLTDAGRFYFTATFRNGVGVTTGQGFFAIQLAAGDTIFAHDFELP